jgi:aminoglycoside phosphotransferase (APT) family kinase protein
MPPAVPPEGALLEQCLDFLGALHAAGRAGTGFEPSPVLNSETLAEVCAKRTAARVRALGRSVEARTARLPRIPTHGDFGHANLLAQGGRLSGVVDWNKAAPAGLPLLDLFNLLLTSEAARSGRTFADAFLRYLFPLVAAGGDERLRGFSHRVGIEPTTELLEALAVAYWLDRAASQVATYADRQNRPAWLNENVARIAEAVPIS